MHVPEMPFFRMEDLYPEDAWEAQHAELHLAFVLFYKKDLAEAE